MNAGGTVNPDVPLTDGLRLGEDLERRSENEGNTQKKRLTELPYF